MKVKVKICGVRTLKTAEIAYEAGADFIGLNFVPTSQRLIGYDNALAIVKNLKNKVKFVGVFQNQDIDLVNSIAESFNLDYVQLHGAEDEQYINSINTKVIKALTFESDYNEQSLESYKVDYFLLDRSTRGSGEMVNKQFAKSLSNKYKVFLAGGLTPDNIVEYIKDVNPIAVDVAGGVETNESKDPEKIRLFIRRAKEVDI